MQSSMFLARLLGPLFIVIGVGMLVNQSIYEMMIGEFLHSSALIYLSGLLSLLGGLAIVNVHNSWRFEWPFVITVLGWLLLIGGVIRIVLPQFVVTIGTTIYGPRAALVVVSIAALGIGGVLTFNGYRQNPRALRGCIPGNRSSAHREC